MLSWHACSWALPGAITTGARFSPLPGVEHRGNMISIDNTAQHTKTSSAVSQPIEDINATRGMFPALDSEMLQTSTKGSHSSASTTTVAPGSCGPWGLTTNLSTRNQGTGARRRGWAAGCLAGAGSCRAQQRVFCSGESTRGMHAATSMVLVSPAGVSDMEAAVHPGRENDAS